MWDDGKCRGTSGRPDRVLNNWIFDGFTTFTSSIFPGNMAIHWGVSPPFSDAHSQYLLNLLVNFLVLLVKNLKQWLVHPFTMHPLGVFTGATPSCQAAILSHLALHHILKLQKHKPGTTLLVTSRHMLSISIYPQMLYSEIYRAFLFP